MKKIFLICCSFFAVLNIFSQTYTFTGNGYWDISSNWSGNTIPPATLPAGSTIIISPIQGGSCTLNVPQSISPGASLIVSAGAVFIISGGINITSSVPIVTTSPFSSTAANAFTGGGNVIDDGGSNVRERGVVWSKNPNPTIADNKTNDRWGSGSFTSYLVGLSFSTTYYVRAYATNSMGTAYGNEVSITTQALSGVIICNQEWTNKNLDIVTYRNGDTIPQITSKAQWDTMTTGGWCYSYFYANDNYGDPQNRFYNSYAVNDPRGLAPEGWHIPCDSEWTILTNCLGGKNIAGDKMKDTSSLYWNTNAGATNSSGFSAKGGGQYTSKTCNYAQFNVGEKCEWQYQTYVMGTGGGGPSFYQAWNPTYKEFASWWSTTESGPGNFICRLLGANFLSVDTFSSFRHDAFSVRCIKGSSNLVCNTTLPVISTDSISVFGANYANCGGNIASGNTLFVTERGVVWDTLPNPTTANHKDTSGRGNGHFTVNITGLMANKTYYVRAFATNSMGTAYGNQVTVTTANYILPTVATWYISNNSTTASAGGKITDNGGSQVTARGMVWSTNTAPTLADHFTNDGSGVSTYTSNIAGLISNTTYYIRAYATNAGGTAYGNEVTINTAVAIPPSVIVCNKVWMQKNLDVATYRNGDPIPHVTDSATWVNLTSGAWCWYNNDSATYASTYGKLYNWYAANDPRNLAPVGFHVPNNNEWAALISCQGNGALAANALRDTGITFWKSPNAGANNSSGFTALPGGYRSEIFYGTSIAAIWWSAGPADMFQQGKEWDITYNAQTNNFPSAITHGFSVRCIRDSSFTSNNLPVITTTNLSGITANTSVSGGVITSDGGSPVTERGVVWNTAPNPSLLTTNKTVDGTGTGSFTSNLTGLTVGTTYYVWAYATNASGTAYGNQVIFTTSAPLIPSLTTIAATNMGNATAANAGGIISSNYGGPAITARGVVWSTSPNPTILSSKTINGNGTGTFSSNLTNLQPATVYYLRAYATNSTDTYYGNELSFKTLDASFPVVTICNQVWMTQNLNTSKFRNGDPIPQVTNLSAWASTYSAAWCWYNNDSATYAATYGKLYNWYAVNDPRGIAPIGWHVASNAEWDTLSTCLGGNAVAGGTLKEAGTSHWLSPNTGATNSSGFTALPGCFRYSSGDFNLIGYTGYWWTSSASYARDMSNQSASLGMQGGMSPNFGFSVRCTRD